MKLLLTGLNGSLAPVLARVWRAQGFDVVGWDRHAVPPDDAAACAAWIETLRPQAIAHLAMGSADWARRLAAHAAARGLPFVFTSSAMVFHDRPDGPHGVHDERNAQDDYGRYKRDCEDAVQDANAQACVARIGWQIDPAQPGNNMLMALDRWQAERGQVAASSAWRPACSFMEDTALALAGLLRQPAPGVTHLDSNADEGHDFVQIVRALQRAFGRAHWQVVPNQDYRHDQRLRGGGARVPPLSRRLPDLRPAGG